LDYNNVTFDHFKSYYDLLHAILFCYTTYKLRQLHRLCLKKFIYRLFCTTKNFQRSNI